MRLSVLLLRMARGCSISSNTIFSAYYRLADFLRNLPIEVEGKRVLMFKIPASPRNIVMKWKGIAYGCDGEILKPLNQSKQDEIRYQTPELYWSAEVVQNATIDDLDEVAIAKSKMMFKKMHNRIPAEEVNKWSIEEFLSKCELMVDGKLRRADIILLGKMFSDKNGVRLLRK